MQLLDDDFIKQYENKEVPFGPLGYITFKRNFARFIEEENRTEEWFETCRRVLEGNFKLEIEQLSKIGKYNNDINESLRNEIKIAYNDMFHLKWLPAGRGLWCSGTSVGNINGSSLTNCYFVEVRPEDGKVSYPFMFAMDMLMLGAGVGFGVSETYLKYMPEVKNEVKLYIVCSPDHRDYQFFEAQDIPLCTHQYVVVEDSREGWLYALKKVIDSSFLSKNGTSKTLVIDVSDVRPSGERIKSFGGKASGPAPLVELLREVNKILNSRIRSCITDVDCTDIMNLLGRCVVSGNVRRSAMLALGDSTSTEFRKMKTYDAVGLKNFKHKIKEIDDPLKIDLIEYEKWMKEQLKSEVIQHHRWASNNSLLVTPDFDVNSIVEGVINNGEPGFLNLDLVQNYGRLIDGRQEGIDRYATGTNPCGEISLESFEPCNLAEIFPFNCTSNEEVFRVLIHAYKYAKRVTLSPYNWIHTQKVVERNRRIGVSISGFQDWILQYIDRINIFKMLLNDLYNDLKKQDKSFSNYLEIKESIKLTTVKPSGTISLLAGVSPGVHWPYADYYIRRIQFQDNDPLAEYCKELGFNVRPATVTPRAVIVEFPIKAATASLDGFKSTADITIEEQLQFQELIQTYWADNQVSCTINFRKDEVDKLPKLLQEYIYKLKSTSLLPYFDIGRDESLKEYYPDLPYEPITKEKYEEMLNGLKGWPSRITTDKKGLEIELDECKGGICPIK